MSSDTQRTESCISKTQKDIKGLLKPGDIFTMLKIGNIEAEFSSITVLRTSVPFETMKNMYTSTLNYDGSFWKEEYYTSEPGLFGNEINKNDVDFILNPREIDRSEEP